jgi:hypothetical protein
MFNPVSRRIPGKGQIVEYYSSIFGAATGGWVQVTSPVAGLQGFYFAGESGSSFDSEATSPQRVQTLSYASTSQRTSLMLMVTNPSVQTATVNVVFYDLAGNVVNGGGPFQLLPHAQVSVPGTGVSARVSADVAGGVLASAVQYSNELQVLINGQGERAQSQRLVAPYFKNQAGATSTLVLTNSSGQDARIRVSLFADGTTAPNVSEPFSLRTNGSTNLDWTTLVGKSETTADKGWVVVDADRPITGLVLVTTQTGRTALPLQSAPVDRMLFSRFVDNAELTAYLSLVGNADREAVVTVTLSRPDGTTVAKNDLAVPALSRVSKRIRDLVPVPEEFRGFITVQSTAAIYGVEILDTEESIDTALAPLRLPLRYLPNASVVAPRIVGVSTPQTLDGRRQLNILAENVDNTSLLYVGGRLVPILSMAPSGTQSLAVADIPELEPGFINVKIRTNGIDSNAFPLGVYPDGAAFIAKQGQALFQKVEVTNTGLDLSRTVMVPIRNARVEIVERATGKLLSVTETDEYGRFLAAVPDRPGLTILVKSQLRSAEVKVLDNTAGNKPYVIPLDFDDLEAPLVIVDKTRISGAFNILDLIQRANTLVAQADPQLIPPPVTIYWSEKNNDVVLSKFTGGQIKTTFFDLRTNNAYVLGDRNTDSDEFDDSVILHEYAHMLAARFSRDDSPGGTHSPSDLLDPRLAWSEGWANFFSSAVRGTPLFIDSKGPGVVVRYDLEDNSDRRGYYSEASIQGLLWDLFDEAVDDGDPIVVPFAAIWNAFAELRNERYVYLPDFLEHFVKANPGISDVLRTMVTLRNIDFSPDSRPSVVSSFPRPITVGETRMGTDIDSFTSKRTNLAQSSHFYSFTTTTAGQVFIALNIEGLGPANNPDANDLDLYLSDSNGKVIAQSDQPWNGQPEYILGLRLTPATYYVEVRSFYRRADTNTDVFNSGRYRLSVQLQ